MFSNQFYLIEAPQLQLIPYNCISILPPREPVDICCDFGLSAILKPILTKLEENSIIYKQQQVILLIQLTSKVSCVVDRLTLTITDKVARKSLIEAQKNVNRAIPAGQALCAPFFITIPFLASEQIAVQLTAFAQGKQEQFYIYLQSKPSFDASLLYFDSFAQLRVSAFRNITLEQKLVQFEPVYTEFEQQFLNNYRHENKINTELFAHPADESIMGPLEVVNKVYRRHEDKTRAQAMPRRGFQFLQQQDYVIEGQSQFFRSQLVKSRVGEIATVVVRFINSGLPEINRSGLEEGLKLIEFNIEQKDVVIDGLKRADKSQLIQGEIIFKLLPMQSGTLKLKGWKVGGERLLEDAVVVEAE